MANRLVEIRNGFALLQVWMNISEHRSKRPPLQERCIEVTPCGFCRTELLASQRRYTIGWPQGSDRRDKAGDEETQQSAGLLLHVGVPHRTHKMSRMHRAPSASCMCQRSPPWPRHFLTIGPLPRHLLHQWSLLIHDTNQQLAHHAQDGKPEVKRAQSQQVSEDVKPETRRVTSSPLPDAPPSPAASPARKGSLSYAEAASKSPTSSQAMQPEKACPKSPSTQNLAPEETVGSPRSHKIARSEYYPSPKPAPKPVNPQEEERLRAKVCEEIVATERACECRDSSIERKRGGAAHNTLCTRTHICTRPHRHRLCTVAA